MLIQKRERESAVDIQVLLKCDDDYGDKGDDDECVDDDNVDDDDDDFKDVDLENRKSECGGQFGFVRAHQGSHAYFHCLSR